MRVLDSAGSRHTAEGPIPAVSVYLTDEVFLYRVADRAGSGVDETVALEDCYALDVVRVPVRDLHSRRLRVVTPAPED